MAAPRPRRLLHTAGGTLAVVRLAAIPIFFAAERLVEHSSTNTGAFEELLALAALYAAGAFAAELRGRRLLAPWQLGTVDLILISALVATSGGPFSELRYAFFLLPIGAALLLRPRATLAASVAIVVAYVLISLTYPLPADAATEAGRFELTQILFLVWTGATATLISLLLARRAREIEALARERTALAESRGRLVAQALDAEDMARRRLAEALHDDALQNVLAARHELTAEDEPRLDLVAEGIDRTVRQLREAVFDLHPYLLERADLGVALRAVADRAARRAGFEVRLEVDDAALGVHDQLLFSIGRELITNVERHAHASRLWIALRAGPETVDLTVSDDGRGIESTAAALAPRAGHIGLASSAERAEAVGGTFEVSRGPDGRGTHARVRLPAGRRDDARQPVATLSARP